MVILTGGRRALLPTQDREILRLAVPAFGALVSEPLFLLADSSIVGHLGTPQLAGLGVAGVTLQSLVGLFIFLAYATTSMVARSVGAGDTRAALERGIDGIWLALLLGLAAMMLLMIAVDPILAVFHPAPGVVPFASTYLRIALLGLPQMLLLLAATGVLRGLQDTRTPLIVVVAGNLANIGLNLTLVYGAGLGIVGSAWGTVIAQSAVAGALILVVARAARAQGARLWPDLTGIRRSALAGIPLTVRTVTLRVALLVTAYVAAHQGAVATATHQIAFTVWTFLAFALDAIAIAGQAITGRLLGAADVVGARRATGRMLTWGLATGAVFGLGLVLVGPMLGRLFTADPAVTSLLGPVLLVAAVFQPVSGVVFVLDGVLIGAGDGRYLAVAGVVTLVVFAPLALCVLFLDGGLVWLWWAFGAFMLARMVTLVRRARSDAWLVTGAC